MTSQGFIFKTQPSIAARLLARQVRPKDQWQYTFDEPEVDVDDIQGDAFRGFNKPHLAILAIDIVDDQPATIQNTKKWLTDHVIPDVTTARDIIQYRELFRLMRERRDGVKPTSVAQICLNVSFSYDALLKLAPNKDVNKFYEPGKNVAFKIGLPPRSTYLHDPSKGEGAQQNWIVGAKKNPHILIQVASDRKALIQEEIDSLQDGLKSLGNPLKITYQEFGKRREDFPGHEHFGFLDGVSNFGVRGTYKEQGTGKLLYITPRFLDEKDPRFGMYGLPGQRLIWPGEVILGLPKQNDKTRDPEQANQPGSSSYVGPEWAKNGTYLVYRRLRQDVPKFWKFMTESAAEIAKHPDMAHFTKDHMGAKVVARWKSGTPVIREPSTDNPKLGADRLANNAFVYQTKEGPYALKPHGHTDGFPTGSPDPLGIVCPLSAHLRKVQPRDASTDIGNQFDTLKHLIIRRGIQYGDVIDDIMVEDGKDRGLMFVSYQASIEDQFEFLITHWANNPTNPHNGGGHDMVIGQSKATNRERSFDVRLPDGTVKTLTTTDEWVIPTGGGYFFVPSISALKNVIAN
ncbi:dye-decolorizing peroxidase msp1-like [Acanthaster planci]|uniref:Dye-decolorizing peroxidase msp1-like n=1 Tax=Acanthaster planci TaxID=133434 RepID=A0A8B7ZNF9_ACAPL|nr:dye-decolorizing peroxidase msp1-like [Acanthaster planci]XP_022106437.1 dye-decolorizing peroxidase msp1-like [Acanthaster planci]